MIDPQQRCCILCVCCVCGSAGQVAALAGALKVYDETPEEGDAVEGAKEPRYHRMARRLLAEFKLTSS